MANKNPQLWYLHARPLEASVAACEALKLQLRKEIREVVTSESDAVLKALTGKVSQEEQERVSSMTAVRKDLNELRDALNHNPREVSAIEGRGAGRPDGPTEVGLCFAGTDYAVALRHHRRKWNGQFAKKKRHVSEEVCKPFGSSGSEAAMQSLFVQTGEAAKCVPMLGMLDGPSSVGHLAVGRKLGTSKTG
ncbi:unnamed protein product [Cladocopium goreaui]|uniref:Uncharacterized protein n=1 Tax=Cladocopium goreaui TaxID=2562237 RepID=A0A9P1CMT3_9DINO|nr:unnamed protein product [Cladocopium goreaui]